MGDAARSYPCTGRPPCGGTALLKFEPAHRVPEGMFESGGSEPGDVLDDRYIFECDTCPCRWYEDGRPLVNMDWAQGEEES